MADYVGVGLLLLVIILAARAILRDLKPIPVIGRGTYRFNGQVGNGWQTMVCSVDIVDETRDEYLVSFPSWVMWHYGFPSSQWLPKTSIRRRG